METILGLGIVWTVYGILGLFGIQHIPEEYKNKSWTQRYIRSCGIGWLILGIADIVLYLVISAYEIKWPIIAVLIILFAIPYIIYSSYTDKKYKVELESECEG
jgi:Ca2+/Na+ antiporter